MLTALSFPSPPSLSLFLPLSTDSRRGEGLTLTVGRQASFSPSNRRPRDVATRLAAGNYQWKEDRQATASIRVSMSSSAPHRCPSKTLLQMRFEWFICNYDQFWEEKSIKVQPLPSERELLKFIIEKNPFFRIVEMKVQRNSKDKRIATNCIAKGDEAEVSSLEYKRLEDVFDYPPVDETWRISLLQLVLLIRLAQHSQKTFSKKEKRGFPATRNETWKVLVRRRAVEY